MPFDVGHAPTLGQAGEMPKRIQRLRKKGWSMPRSAVYVGRPTPYGNPYKVSVRPPLWPAERAWGRAEAVECYELMLAGGWRLKSPPGFQIVEKAMAELEGRDLCCWCPLDQPCHADVLMKYANSYVTPAGDVVL